MTNHTYQELLNKNREFLWNPFTQMKNYLEDKPLIIERGEGVKLYDIEGNEYWDGNASVWLNAHGHNNAILNAAIKDQLANIAHSTLLGSSNVPAILLSEELVKITPNKLQKVFYSDSGATAVEIALKMAYLYWQYKGQSSKKQFVTMENAYHGDTLGAVSVGGINLFHSIFSPLLFSSISIPYPYNYRYEGTPEGCYTNSIIHLREVLQDKADGIAGIIVEPMVQGAGGIIPMPKGFLSEVAALCQEYDVLLIADEVATGFGRTAEMFACDHEQIEPDIMVIGKMLTGGYLPVAATLASNEIYDQFYNNNTFYHGHSFTGNQLGCAVALANLRLYETDKTILHVKRSAKWLAHRLEKFKALDHVGDVRQMGLMVGLELVANKANKLAYPSDRYVGNCVCRRARELGLITRPLGDVVTFIPPLVATIQDIESMLNILEKAIIEVTKL